MEKPDAAQRVSNYGEGLDLFETLLELIASAERRLWVKAAWWDASPKGRQLAEAVVGAHERGIDVLVMCRPEASNDVILRELRQADITLIGVRFIHEKELLADDAAVSHSMNFTSKEIERNQNSGFLHRDPEVVEAVELGFRALIDNCKAAASVGAEEYTPSDKLIPPTLRRYMTQFKTLNPLQSLAVPKVLTSDRHVMVVAPTSSGKTLIGEVAALRSIVLEGRPAVWLLPARALAAEVGDTAQRWNSHGISTIELTGETNVSSATASKAQLWVATTEKFEALYRRGSLREFMGRIGCLIIDEVHLVGDPQRGATLESLIARLRAVEDRTRIVALSATVANAPELAGWFNADLVTSAWRPTILTTHLVPYDEPPPGSRAEEYQQAKDAVVLPLLSELVGRDTEDSTVLATEDDRPGSASVLVFCGSKAGAQRTAGQAADVPFRNRDLEQLADECFAHGVGIHFRGAPRGDRALKAFNARKIRTLVATSGLSTGVNTPARAVIIRDLELGMTPIEVSQVQQMFGRAGRAGQEPEGFGFMLVPREHVTEWRIRLAEGYAAKSQVVTHLGDALLAELLIGSVTDRDSAQAWFKETFAYAQAGEAADIDDSLDHLVLRGFIREDEDGLAVTEIGSLTSRLMIDVESAGNLLMALAEAPIPATAAEAEELLLQVLTTSVLAHQEWPVNEKTYGDVVDTLLFDWAPRVTARMGSKFGPRFCMAAAGMALRDPRRLRGRPPPGLSLTDFKRAIEDMPRYLAWVAALGYVESSTWAPAVAGDLCRRLTWWHLQPHPERGSGRLLWLLEKLLEPEHRRQRMQDLWTRARQAGFVGPDNVNARPRNVDVSMEEFVEVLLARADLELAPPADLELSIKTACKSGRITVMSNTGARRALTTSRPVHGRIELAAPPGVSTEIAADVFLYSQGGDFAYSNLIADLPAGHAHQHDPLAEAKLASRDLPDLVATTYRPKGVRKLLMNARKRRLASILPLLAPDPQLKPVALALAEHDSDPRRGIINLRQNLELLLDEANEAEPRPAAAVLRSGAATPAEFQLALAALTSALQLEVGIAHADGRPVALIRIDGEWQLVTPTASTSVRVDPVFPDSLPPVVASLRAGQVEPPLGVGPRCAWMTDFIPT